MLNMHSSTALSFFFVVYLLGWSQASWVGSRGGRGGRVEGKFKNVTTLGPVVFIALEIACCILYVSLFDFCFLKNIVQIFFLKVSDLYMNDPFLQGGFKRQIFCY